MMLVVALAAVGAWLIAVAVRVVNDPNGDAIFCVYQSPETGEVRYLTQCNPKTFWPRYVRKLMGRTWPGDYRCPCGSESNLHTRSGKRLVRSFDRIEASDAFGARLEAEHLSKH